MDLDNKARTLLSFLDSLTDFQVVTQFDYGNYGHMGATISAALLQAGVSWKETVQPRVAKILTHQEAITVSGFLTLLERQGASTLLGGWKGRKATWILSAARFFAAENVETEQDLRTWLERPGNAKRLDDLDGVGDKTIDFFRMLVGIPTNAGDRHLHTMLSEAKVDFDGYDEAHEIINRAADLKLMDRRLFDMSIWKYMSDRSKNKRGRSHRPCS